MWSTFLNYGLTVLNLRSDYKPTQPKVRCLTNTAAYRKQIWKVIRKSEEEAYQLKLKWKQVRTASAELKRWPRILEHVLIRICISRHSRTPGCCCCCHTFDSLSAILIFSNSFLITASQHELSSQGSTQWTQHMRSSSLREQQQQQQPGARASLSIAENKTQQINNLLRILM